MTSKKDLHNAVSELKRVLKKDGVLVVGTPHKNLFTDFVRSKILSNILKYKGADSYFIMGKSFKKSELEKFKFKVNGCLAWVTWNNIGNPLLSRILDEIFWYFQVFSGCLVGVYKKS